MSATAIQPSKSSEGAGVVDGVINWGRETAADLWQSRKFTTPHIIANIVQHGWKKGLERQKQDMAGARDALVRTGLRTAAIGTIIATKGAATEKVGLLSHAVKRTTGIEVLPDMMVGAVDHGAKHGAKSAVQSVVNSDEVSAWRESRAPKAKPASRPGFAP